MELLSTKNATRRKPQLVPDDWIAAALEMLVLHGVESVQITTLATQLNVSRGSFYWHFENREALLAALLEEWHARNTDVMLEALASAATFTDGILNLFDVWVDHNRFDPQLDQAIRDWARRDQTVLAKVTKEDESRVESISRFFAKHDYEKTDAFIRARVIYFTQISYYALGVEESTSERLSYLSSYYRSFTGREIDDATARAFEQRIANRQ